MQPFDHPTCNDRLNPPRGVSKDECQPLPIQREPGKVTSHWKATRAEIDLLMAGGSIGLTIEGMTHPPLSLRVMPPAGMTVDPADVNACMRRMVQLMWAKVHEKETVVGMRTIIAAEFEPEVIQAAFASVRFGREPDPLTPVVPMPPEEGSPMAMMSLINDLVFCGMGLGDRPNLGPLAGKSLSELGAAWVEAGIIQQELKVSEGVVHVLPAERYVSAAHVLHHWRLRPQDGRQEIIVNDGEQALVIVRVGPVDSDAV